MWGMFFLAKYNIVQSYLAIKNKRVTTFALLFPWQIIGLVRPWGGNQTPEIVISKSWYVIGKQLNSQS